MTRHRNILIVDDDDSIRSLLRLVAERRGFTVDVAIDGAEALQRLDECTYDLAVVDLMMPRISGYDLVARMRDLSERPAVVIVTAMTETLIGQLDAAVVHSIVRKPFDVDAIGGLMTEIVAKIAARRETRAALPDNLLLFPSEPDRIC
jgi:DNA-binding response OmpR family regulator